MRSKKDYRLNKFRNKYNLFAHNIQRHVNTPPPVKSGRVSLKQPKQTPAAIEIDIIKEGGPFPIQPCYLRDKYHVLKLIATLK